jgi:tRNA threonylcarbamoyladenosine biosynthesis protein TsaE
MRLRTITTQSDVATREVGRALSALVAPGDVIVLSGDLGAGKTQLTKGLAVGLGVAEAVTSPTFNILLVHEGRIPLYHFDLYRLEFAGQLDDLDYWGTLEADGVSVVEWGDRFVEAIPRECLIVRMLITGDDARALELDARGPRGEQLASSWAAACSALPAVGVEGESERS